MAVLKPSEIASTLTRGFEIGRIGTDHYWTNPAINHENGKLTNDALLRMQDPELRKLAHTEDGEFFFAELYRRPKDTGIRESQGGEPGEVYEGVHRAQIILEFRKAQRDLKDLNKPIDPQTKANVRAMLDMVREHLIEKGIVIKKIK